MWQLTCVIFANAIFQCIPQAQIRSSDTWIVDRAPTSGQTVSVSGSALPYRILETDLIDSPVRVVSLRDILSRGSDPSVIQTGTSRARTRTRDPSTSVFYSQYDGFQPIRLSVNDEDSCYVRLKSEFDRAYPRLPPLVPDVTSINSLADPVPRRISQLPDGISPLYVTAGAADPIAYVPYRLENQGAPLRVPFFRETRRIAYPEFPLLLPYTQLSIDDSSENRKYVIFIPFQPNVNRVQSSCPSVSVPVISRRGEFPKYVPYRVIYEGRRPASVTTVLL